MRKEREPLIGRLVCPVTHERLELNADVREPALVNQSGTQHYHMRSGAWDLVPPMLPAELSRQAEMWEVLQRNGAASYSADPLQNLSTQRTFASAFQDQAQLRGSVLDIGCGPQRHKPMYLDRVLTEDIVGIDPLPGEENRDFPFVIAIAELLPFPDTSFDNVVFCRTLDHMLDFRTALVSAMRVVRKGGRLLIVMDDVGASDLASHGRWRRYTHFAIRGTRQVVRSVRSHGIGHTIGYLRTVADMKTPAGAIDFFHSYFPKRVEVEAALKGAGARQISVSMLGNELLVTATKQGAT